MLNVDQSDREFLPISPGSSSRVARQTKEDPGDEVGPAMHILDYYDHYSFPLKLIVFKVNKHENFA